MSSKNKPNVLESLDSIFNEDSEKPLVPNDRTNVKEASNTVEETVATRKKTRKKESLKQLPARVVVNLPRRKVGEAGQPETKSIPIQKDVLEVIEANFRGSFSSIIDVLIRRGLNSLAEEIGPDGSILIFEREKISENLSRVKKNK